MSFVDVFETVLHIINMHLCCLSNYWNEYWGHTVALDLYEANHLVKVSSASYDVTSLNSVLLKLNNEMVGLAVEWTIVHNDDHLLERYGP